MDYLEPYNFYFELPLYTVVKTDIDRSANLLSLLGKEHKIDAYNPDLKENTTYTIKQDTTTIYGGIPNLSRYNGYRTFSAVCLRNEYTITFFTLLYREGPTYFLQKVGQYPTIADIHISRVRQYDKVLSKPKLREFTKAIGLAANGVGIGSFVYLRRIFEDLIEDAYQEAIKAGNFDDGKYVASRMGEKIELLKVFLPEFLVQNKGLYGILSKGIHELEEQECLSHFEAVKVGIELILDEKVEKIEKKKKLEEAQKKIQAITQVLSEKS